MLIQFFPALLMGLYISIITILLGITFSNNWFLLVSALYFLFVLTLRTRFVSPTYVLGLVVLLYFIAPILREYEWFSLVDVVLQQMDIRAVSLLLALSLIVEGCLIRLNGPVYTSPRLEKSKRGKWVGYHEANRLWILPVIAFVPAGIIPTFEYWPVFSVNEISLQPVLFPLLIGFQLQVRGSHPTNAIRRYGQSILLVGLAAILLVIAIYYVPWLAIILAIGTVIAREVLTFMHKKRDEVQSPYFSSSPKGCVIVGVLPGSPAEKMKLTVGETIQKVNGMHVSNEHEFYERLQLNSAFCKLEVLDFDGEVRFAQTPLYDGQHHQIGILFVKEEHVWQDTI
ncbi:PDZ domain-containing protein [Bacillus sp. JCM 19034]|uniref:PDZ domain-containing protein n=1 Tax=Bacillus sp. JCM 19034 TaxID=1481928 RepID=UPI00078027D8|nr:PDZ domain-containing protein [Bacillus sp. JCM 19034]